MKKRGQRYECANEGQTYREVLNAKHNGKVLENGDIRVGNEFAMNIKTNILYKL